MTAADREAAARRQRAQTIALWRWALTEPAMDPALTARQRGAVVRQLAAREHEGPSGAPVSVSRRTIDRWVVARRAGGFDALVPAPRQCAPRTDDEVVELAAGLKMENPARTAAQVRRILAARLRWAPSERAIQRWFAARELTSRPDGTPPQAFGRFTADAVNEIWTADLMNGPRVAGKATFLAGIIDDRSRFLTGCQFVRRADAVRFAGVLRAAIARHGIPRVLYAEYVPRNIFGILCPAALCAWRRGDAGGPSPAASWQAHNAVSLLKGLPSTRPRRGRYPMLENYFVKPETVERIRSSWIAPEIERYVTWLAGHGYSSRCVWRRVPLLIAFAEFAHRRGARSAADLPAHVDAFVAWRVRQSRQMRHTSRPGLAKEIRGPVEHMLGVVLAGYSRRGARREAPFTGTLPGFFGTWSKSAGSSPPRSPCTAIIWPHSRPGSTASGPGGSAACPRR